MDLLSPRLWSGFPKKTEILILMFTYIGGLVLEDCWGLLGGDEGPIASVRNGVQQGSAPGLQGATG